MKLLKDSNKDDKIIKNINGRLFITNNSYSEKLDFSNINLKAIEKSYLKSSLDEDTKNVIDKIIGYDKEEKEIRSSADKLKQSEMNRIFKECLYNNYEKRFNTTKRIVIAAMIGEESMHKELHRQEMEEKTYKENRRKCQLYHPLNTIRLNDESIESYYVLNTN